MNLRIGPALRHRLGRFETPAAELYRSIFFDVDEFAAIVARIAPNATRILEIGCGDGSVANRVTRAYPKASYLGIDVATTAGRRFTGNPAQAQFRTVESGTLRGEGPMPFDLVLLVDVLHHVVGTDLRQQILRDAAAMLSRDGTILVKDWARRPGMAYLLGYVSDRYISGDRTVRFMTADELTALVRKALPEMSCTQEQSVGRHNTNVLFSLRR